MDSSAAGKFPLSLVFICRVSQPFQHQRPSAVSACVLCMMLPWQIPLSAEPTWGKTNMLSPRTSHQLIRGDRQHSQDDQRVLLPGKAFTATQATEKRWAGSSQKESHLPNTQVLPLPSSGRHLFGRAYGSPICEPSSEQDHMGNVLHPNSCLHFVSLLFQIPSLSLCLCFLSILPSSPPCFGMPFSPFFLPPLAFICPTWAGWHAHRCTDINTHVSLSQLTWEQRTLFRGFRLDITIGSRLIGVYWRTFCVIFPWCVCVNTWPPASPRKIGNAPAMDLYTAHFRIPAVFSFQ